MKKSRVLTAWVAMAAIGLTLLLSAAPIGAATETVAEGLARTREVWTMAALPGGTALGETGDSLPWGVKVAGHGDAYHVTAADGAGYDGARALRWQAVKAGGTQALYLNWSKDGTAVTDWTGAEEIWLYVDTSSLAATDVRVDVYLTDADGEKWETYEDGHNTDGTYYYQDGTGWKSATLNEWGHTLLASGYVGWVRYPLDGAMYNSRGGNGAMDLSRVQQIGIYIEYNDVSRGAVLVSSPRIAGTFADGPAVVNRGVSLAGAQTLTVDAAAKHQTVRGFGASGCWWAATWSKFWSESMIDRALAYLYDPVEGIGLNTYRYNVGGGTTFDDTIRSTHDIETSPGVFDLTADADNIAVLDKVLAYPVDRLTLFWNSPPSSLTVTGDSKGHPLGQTNLLSADYEAYAAYVAGVTEAFVDAGYPVDYISPFNEPNLPWSAQEQEGCHYEASQLPIIGKMICQQLQAKKLPVKLSMCETSGWDAMPMYANAVLKDTTLAGAIDHLCGHSYGGNAAQKAMAAALAASAGLEVVQSEWGSCDGTLTEPVGSMLELVNMIHEDMTVLNASVWEFWLGVERDTSWPGGLVYLRNNGRVEPSKRMWGMGNYSRFVTGSTRVTLTGDGNGVAASAYVDPVTGKQTVVVINNNTAGRTVALQGTGDHAEVYTTDATRDLNHDGQMDTRYGYVLPARSVTTFVFEGTATAVRGDVNLDGKVSVADVRMALRYAVHKIDLTGQALVNADWNGDGAVKVSDVRHILRHSLGKE